MPNDASIRRADARDLDRVRNLLEANALPVDGVADCIANFRLAFQGEQLVGAAGYEIHGSHGLLRSVVVDAAARGQRLGERLVADVLSDLEAAGVESVYLLTTTADHYFPRFGFKQTERAAVPTPLHASEEFSHACPASARVLYRQL